ncbi:MAG: type II toxin-antitoxin system VapC family toxin [Pseudomonadales bacterium]
MIGLDTNILVRYLTQDDATQAKKANTLIESLSSDSPGFIALVSVVELVWVLEGCYDSDKKDIVTVLDTLLRTRGLVIEQADSVWQALRRFADTNSDFADCLIERCHHAAGCSHTATFDRKAAKSAGMQLLS